MKNENGLLIKKLDGITLDQIIDSYPEEVWEKGGVALSRKNKNIRSVNSAGLCKTLKGFVEEVIDPIVNEYAKNNFIQPGNPNNYQLVRYKQGDFFKNHVDATTEFPRTISILFYLNDNYSGGEIFFPNINMFLKPEANTLIVFPSSKNFSHSAETVTSGTKYVFVGFRMPNEELIK